MNKLSHSVLWIVTVLVTACNIQPKQEPIEEVIDRGLKASTEQALLMAKELETQNGRLPKTINKEGKLETSDYSWWCSGFFPGELWYLYEYNPTPEMKKYAEMYTDRVEEVKHITYSHDVGFMLYCSYGNGYRLTGKPEYKDVMLTGANSLATRYDERVGAIRSWDFNKKIWQFPVIIDNMMNLELLYFASKVTGDPHYAEIANSHAITTAREQFREDYSNYHVVNYDPETGKVLHKQTCQGFSDNSAWARGQAWAVYGFTTCYRYTHDKRYLDQAEKTLNFYLNDKNLPKDLIPYWDFDAPEIPNEPRDVSTAACIASALYEMDGYCPGKNYKELADKILKNLSGPDYKAKVGENGNFILMHSVGSIPHGAEIDVPLNYADYYYEEALIRKRNIENNQPFSFVNE